MNQKLVLPESNNSAVDPKVIKIVVAGTLAAEEAPEYEYHERNTKPSGPESPPGQRPGGKRRQYSNPLNKQMHCAVIDGYIDEPFTQPDIEQWMAQYDIRTGDGTRYKKGYVTTLLSNSYIGKKNKTNRNSVCLDRRFNKSKGVYEYWFVD